MEVSFQSNRDLRRAQAKANYQDEVEEEDTNYLEDENPEPEGADANYED